ncbi:tripartite tricarboxylate transporter substrate binding protein [Aliarcobacter butzleri]|uniref:tripartite tricarboxylate transporter substrate binding protein n=1 Tax=Aliarcobacter butzleri TaxID=28197 RepID=UPI00102D78D4|nr:tripartite tricarboxylate transporter substrate-binding protein [Aliarcobacter butzleri]RZV14056.1 tripartite tricarboxylate transporter substrate binding protein [Aliarcobacter butzleri]RZV19516.1 tripartite tricarboxylate transporter substrate binding protein [Aliarcobacter butzleri]
MKNKFSKIYKNVALASCLVAGIASSTLASSVEKIHFIIPGGAGGGWDGTARGVGEALKKSNLIKEVSYENMSGGGGGTAIAYMIETAARQQNTLMINSTPIVIRSLQGVFPQSFRDLSLVAAVVADYQVLVVKKDSKYNSWADIKAAFDKNPTALKIGGGSSRGSMDHLVAAQIFKASGGNPSDVRYVPYDAGGKALAGLLTGEIEILSTGLGEVIDKHKSGELKIIATTAEETIDGVPSFKEIGVDTYFANWRGFFAAPNLSEEKVNDFAKVFEEMYKTAEWEEIRKRYGWSNLYKPTTEFKTFLETQEQGISSLMKEMGFL